MSPRISRLMPMVSLLLPLLGACTEDTGLLDPEPGPGSLQIGPAAPAPLVPVAIGAATSNLWPYTGTDLAGTAADPINLIFTGAADPSNIRNALMSVDGVRAGQLATFNCTWTDAIGSEQAAYSESGGWTGSVIQLECGSYDPFRFHVRLFPAGPWTVANAHVDVLISNTTDHQVLTWELGEQLVLYDLVRSGLLAGVPTQTGAINAAPTFRSIPPVIYNGLPLSLRALTGGPFSNVSQPVGIPTSGSATVVPLLEAPEAGGTEQEFVINFAQFVPKPFCNDGNEWVRVDGPVHMRQQVNISSSGVLTRQTSIEGSLMVRSFNPITNQVGPAFPAEVRDHYRAHLNHDSWNLLSTREQELATGGTEVEALLQRLQVGSEGRAAYTSTQTCP